MHRPRVWVDRVVRRVGQHEAPSPRLSVCAGILATVQKSVCAPSPKKNRPAPDRVIQGRSHRTAHTCRSGDALTLSSHRLSTSGQVERSGHIAFIVGVGGMHPTDSNQVQPIEAAALAVIILLGRE
ncbi:MAG: hypothetical protein D8M59_07910 [Planctomycetes bacterium]|nr:hypothetical protein [Planctomycetota bacterium]